MTEKSLLRLHQHGMLILVMLLTLALGGYFIWQQIRDVERDSQQQATHAEQQLVLSLSSGLQVLRSYLLQLRLSSEAELRRDIQQQSDIAWQIADQLYRERHDQLPDRELRQLIVQTLRPLRFFDGRGYVFINQLDGHSVLLPVQPELEGQQLLAQPDPDTPAVMRRLIAAASLPGGQGFASYRWQLPDDGRVLQKITHVRRFEPLGWMIGTGDYLRYNEQRLREQALGHLRHTRIGRDGYISVIDQSGRILLSPGNPRSEGRLVSELQGPEREIVERILHTSRNGGGVLRYQWPRPEGQQMEAKLSLVNNFDEWGWVLVSGIYLSELEQLREQRLQQLNDDLAARLLGSLCILALAMLLAVAFSLLYGHWLGKRFARYRADIEASQIRLRQFAETDQLTGLPNHLRLSDRLEHAIAASAGSSQLALLCIDLDHFKNINDSLGHGIGDRLLQLVALQLGGVLSPGDTLSRSGGDEFVVLLENCGCSEQVASVAARLIESCQGSHIIDGQELAVTLSIGIALYPEDGEDILSLRKNADAALYHAKACGRNNYQFFTESMNRRVLQHLQMENLLRQALSRNELHLVYQPKVDLASGLLSGCEALLRWNNPRLGEVPPSTFIPVAEEHGLIDSLGAWALQQACSQVVAWQAAGLPAIRVAVNVSAKQFGQCDLPALVQQTLRQTGLSSDLLELELTESVLAEDYEALQENLTRLKQMGIQLTMDDFGTGFSSLSYLNHFNLDTLKIDRAFIRDLPGNEEHRALTSAIIAMANALGMRCVAEGIETREQMELLRSLGCNYGQGYLFARPLPAEALGELLHYSDSPLVD